MLGVSMCARAWVPAHSLLYLQSLLSRNFGRSEMNVFSSKHDPKMRDWISQLLGKGALVAVMCPSCLFCAGTGSASLPDG